MTRNYRDLTEKTLELAARQLRDAPAEAPPSVIAAHASVAQATATMSLVQALLYIGDTLAQQSAGMSPHRPSSRPASDSGIVST